jgi:hypothetical protein
LVRLCCCWSETPAAAKAWTSIIVDRFTNFLFPEAQLCETNLSKALRSRARAGERVRRNAGGNTGSNDNDRRWSTEQVKISKYKRIRMRGEYSGRIGSVVSKQQTIPLHLYNPSRPAKMQLRVNV